MYIAYKKPGKLAFTLLIRAFYTVRQRALYASHYKSPASELFALPDTGLFTLACLYGYLAHVLSYKDYSG